MANIHIKGTFAAIGLLIRMSSASVLDTLLCAKLSTCVLI
jgi:hypothetical protein